MTTPTATLVPPTGLMTPNPQGASDKPLFALFTSDWLSLQSFIAQAIQLPITQGDFTAKYGAFTDEDQIKNVVAAMVSIQGLSKQFGDPQTLISKLATDPSILESPTAPDALYTHIVWFADKLYQAANSFNQTLGDFEQLLNPANCGTPAECGAVLKTILTGKGGLQSTATDMVGKCNDLIKALAKFQTELTPSVTTMSKYTSKDSTFIGEVDADIGQDTKDITTYTEAAAKAYKSWEDYTIAAVTVSVGLMIISGGMAWPVAAVAAGVLGHDAVEAREAYDTAIKNEHKAEKDKAQKILLKHDLLGLNAAMPNANNAAQEFQKTLELVLGVWTNMGTNIAYIADNFSVEKLGDLNWVTQALDLHKATEDWQQIATAAQSYTSNSLVTYTLLDFGAPLPKPGS